MLTLFYSSENTSNFDVAHMESLQLKFLLYNMTISYYIATKQYGGIKQKQLTDQVLSMQIVYKD